MLRISKQLKSLDFLSPQHVINYKGKTREKSLIGACFTLLLGLITVSLGFLVGKDIFFRTNPTTRMNLKLANENKIFLKDFPISINKLVKMQLNRSKFDEEFTIKSQLSLIDVTSPTIKTNYALKIEPCTEEQLNLIPDWRSTLGPNVSEVDCIQDRMYDQKGNIVDQEPFIRGERAQHLSWLIEIKIERKGDLSEPFPTDFYISLGMPSVYVDNSNYANPEIKKITTLVAPLEQQMSKIVFVSVSQESITSDTGVIFSSLSTSAFSTYKSSETAYSVRDPADKKHLEFIVTGTKMASAYEREYTKLPSVFAEASAMGKLVFWVFKVIIKQVAAYKFYVANVKTVRDCKISANASDSRIEIRSNKNKNTSLPSFCQFVCSSKATFNRNFVSKREISKQFDLLEIRKSIEEIRKTELKLENILVPFKRES